jgi:hypothetical protein
LSHAGSTDPFIIYRDPGGYFRFASLQSEVGQACRLHDVRAVKIEEKSRVRNADERNHLRSSAVSLFRPRGRLLYHAAMLRAIFLTTLTTALFTTMVAFTTGCASRAHVDADPWSEGFAPPERLRTRQMALEPLKPEHAELDYAAFMGSREHLRRTLQWGNWPGDDATVEENRADLERHWREHQANEAYTYAVLAPDRSRSLGCVYLKPLPQGEQVPTAIANLPRPGVRIAYWVVEDSLANDLDHHLVQRMTRWLRSDWGVRTILMPIHRNDARGMRIAEELGYTALPAAEGEARVNYIWQR